MNLIKYSVRRKTEDFKGQNVDQAFERSNKIINLLAKAVLLIMTMLN
jgi:hypothetical protein